MVVLLAELGGGWYYSSNGMDSRAGSNCIGVVDTSPTMVMDSKGVVTRSVTRVLCLSLIHI